MSEGENRANAAIWRWLLLAAFVLSYCALLGLRPLMTPDEARYAEISREMLVSRDWVTPHLNGYLYFEKPPLQYWATAVCFALFGVHEWSARLWSALMYLAAGGAIGWCALRIHGREVAILAMLCYFSMALPFVLGQVETLDSGVAAFLTIALCAFCVAQSDSPSRLGAMLLCWAAMGAAVLSKGLIGIVLPGAVLVLYVLVTRHWQVIPRMRWVPGLALFAAIVTPWFIVVSIRNPGFAQFFFVHEHLQRYLTTVHERVEPWWYFIAVLALGLLPWTPRAARAMVDALSGREAPAPEPARQPDRVRTLLLFAIWSLFVTFFFSLSQSKLMPYVLPVFPAIALIMAWRICAEPARGFRLTIVIAALLWVCVLIASFTSGTKLLTRFDSAEAAWILRWARAACVAAGALLVFSARAFSRSEAPSHHLKAWQLLAAAQIAGIFLLTLAATPYGASRSAVRYIAAAPQSFTTASEIYSVGELDQSLVFYLRRRVTLVEFINEFEYGMSVEPGRASLSLEAFRERWLAEPHPVAVIERGRITAVEALRLPARIVYRDRRGAVMIPR